MIILNVFVPFVMVITFPDSILICPHRGYVIISGQRMQKRCRKQHQPQIFQSHPFPGPLSQPTSHQLSLLMQKSKSACPSLAPKSWTLHPLSAIMKLTEQYLPGIQEIQPPQAAPCPVLRPADWTIHPGGYSPEYRRHALQAQREGFCVLIEAIFSPFSSDRIRNQSAQSAKPNSNRAGENFPRPSS